MRFSVLICALILLIMNEVDSQTDPVITQWSQTTGNNGYKSYKSDVTKIQYSTDSVYVSANSIPSYSIGPWSNNPNDASPQSFTFQIPRNPTQNIGTKTTVPLGNIGVWKNGVVVFNADDGQSYNNLGVWRRNALIFEGSSFDNCKGHPAQGGVYHHHVNPVCLYNSTDSTKHSPLLGFAFDGFPIYGRYGYTNPNDATSAIKRITTSYRLRSISDRTTLANGTVLSAAYQGPAIGATYPLSSFLEDYEFVSGYGDLDVYNGRFGKTPEYPNGIYAYFVATDATNTPVYPFIIGPSYYGNVGTANIGPGGGKVTPSESVTTYFSNSNALKYNIFLYVFVALIQVYFK